MPSDDFYNVLKHVAFRGLLGDELQYLKSNYLSNNNEVISKAKRDKVLPFLGNFLVSSNLSVNPWMQILEEYRNRNLAVVDILNNLFARFSEFGITHVFLYENFGSLLSSETDISQFASGDVDLFAIDNQRDKIDEVMLKSGFVKIVKGSSEEVVNSTYSQISSTTGVKINIMWQALSRIGLPFEFDAKKEIEWNLIEKYRSTAIQLPGKTDLLYLCALHISVHLYSRAPGIRLYKDIQNLVNCGVDFQSMWEKAQRNNHHIRLAAVLEVFSGLYGVINPIMHQMDTLNSNEKKRVKAIVHLVLDKNRRLLINKGGLYRRILLEAYSDNKGIIAWLLQTSFPKREWIQKHYLKKNIISAYMKYYYQLAKLVI